MLACELLAQTLKQGVGTVIGTSPKTQVPACLIMRAALNMSSGIIVFMRLRLAAWHSGSSLHVRVFWPIRRKMFIATGAEAQTRKLVSISRWAAAPSPPEWNAFDTREWWHPPAKAVRLPAACRALQMPAANPQAIESA